MKWSWALAIGLGLAAAFGAISGLERGRRRPRPRPRMGSVAERERQRAFVQDLAHAFTRAGATQITVPLLVAHSALATGYGRNVHGNNIGVLRAGPSYGGEVLEVPTREWDGSRYVHSLARWRAYASLEDSAKDLLELLGASRYAEARSALEAGHREWFRLLGAAGFYTEPTERHYPRYLSVLERVNAQLGGLT